MRLLSSSSSSSSSSLTPRRRLSTTTAPTNHNNNNQEDWTTPLLLSCMAGLSTCLGAAIVLCTEQPTSATTTSTSAASNTLHNNNVSTTTATLSGTSVQDAASSSLLSTSSSHQRRRRVVLGHEHMAFALTLAGSVMITVSIASILPECFTLDSNYNYTTTNNESTTTTTTRSSEYNNHYFAMIVERCIAFGLGCGLYILLSKLAFPEPDAILGLESPSKDDGTAIGAAAAPRLLLLDKMERQQHTAASTIVSPTTTTTTTTSPSVPTYRKRTTTTTTTITNNGNPDTGDAALILEQQQQQIQQKLLLLTSDDVSSSSSKIRSGRCCRLWLPPFSSGSTSMMIQYTRGTDIPNTEARRAWRVAMLLFVSLTVHNFPEGLAVAASAMHSQHLGITTTIAIALHNIPEGIAIAIPCLAARPDAPWLAFGLASLSGLAEPLGATVALLLLHGKESNDQQLHNSKMTESSRTPGTLVLDVMLNMKNVLAFVAGIMITVAAIELFPEALRHMKEKRTPGYMGTITGMVVMLASDAYLEST